MAIGSFGYRDLSLNRGWEATRKGIDQPESYTKNLRSTLGGMRGKKTEPVEVKTGVEEQAWKLKKLIGKLTKSYRFATFFFCLTR